MRDKRIGMIVAAGALLLLAVRHPSADIRIQTQDLSDPAPHRVQAAVDLGVAAVSVMVSWSGRRLIDGR